MSVILSVEHGQTISGEVLRQLLGYALFRYSIARHRREMRMLLRYHPEVVGNGDAIRFLLGESSYPDASSVPVSAGGSAVACLLPLVGW